MRVLLPSLALLISKVLLGYIVRSETLDILEEKQIADRASEEVEDQCLQIGAGIQMVEERTDKLGDKMRRTKKEFEEHQRRMSELKSINLGLLAGESQSSFVECCQVLGEIRNVLKRK